MSSVFARALLLFDRYADMGVAERTSNLASLCREDKELHDALIALLVADAHSQPLDRAPIEAVAAKMQADSDVDGDQRIGKQVGSWRIVGIIDQGGMGTVYRVERADRRLEQTAALKYVRAEVPSPNLVAAFYDERNVLASLSHPGIVPLLDGGVDEDGQPWLVMQYVEGEPIDQWCNRRKLPIRERIALFDRACDAVVYAHGRGILHQDIKPSNLLVSEDGNARLLDFGLSTPIEAVEGGGLKRLAMTPGYTAPEVLLGGATGFTSDIYSLGILLCRLLCDQWVVQSNAMQHAPKAPSAMVQRMTDSMLADRGVTGRRSLARLLSGELDSIVLRCIDVDPAKRYASVDELQSDLRNWLSGAPVHAYGHGVAYRLRCLIRRHAYLASATAVATCLLVALGVSWAWQRAYAEREQLAASHVDRLLESSMGMATLSGLGDVPLTPAVLLERSEAHLRDESLRGQPEVRSRGLSVLSRSWALLGDYDKAERLAREATQLAAGNALQTAFSMSALAHVQNKRARHAEAGITAREGLAQLPSRLSDQYRLARVRLTGEIAIAESGQGHSRQAFDLLSSAIAEAEKLSALTSDAVVAQLLTQRGTWHRWRFRMTESDVDLTRAIALAQRVDPVIADDARESLVRTVRASRKPGREQRSLKLAEELLDSRQRTLGEHHPQTGMAWAELAFIRLLNADNDGAQEAVGKARDILKESVGESHPAYARMLVAQAFIYSLNGRVEESIGEIQRAIEIYRASYGNTHEMTLEARALLANARWIQFRQSGDTARLAEAAGMIRSMIDDSVAAHGTVAAIHRLAYADLLAEADRGEAAKQLRQARIDAVWQYGRDSQELLSVRGSELANAMYSGGDPAWIEASFTSLINDLRAIDTLYARAISHSAWLNRARWLQDFHQFDEARAALVSARREGEVAGQARWVEVADRKLQELDRETDVPSR